MSGDQKNNYDANGVGLDSKTFLKYCGGPDAEVFAVPEGVTHVGEKTFCDCYISGPGDASPFDGLAL